MLLVASAAAAGVRDPAQRSRKAFSHSHLEAKGSVQPFLVARDSYAWRWNDSLLGLNFFGGSLAMQELELDLVRHQQLLDNQSLQVVLRNEDGMQMNFATLNDAVAEVKRVREEDRSADAQQMLSKTKTTNTCLCMLIDVEHC